jgi:predicted Zn-dependent protease
LFHTLAVWSNAVRGACLLVILLCLAGCQGPTLSAWSLSGASAEALAGARAAPAVEARYGGVLRDAVAEARLEAIGRRLTAGTSEACADYQYRLLRANRPNAVSLPGGRIYLSRGLYDRLTGDAEIAAVLAHEIAHLVAKDHFQPRCATAEDALDREMAADAHAVTFLRSAGVDPAGLLAAIQLVADVQPTAWSDTRIGAVRNRLEQTR